MLKEDSFVWRDITVNFGILGESHFVHFSKPNESFAEICACVPAQFDADKTTILTSGFISHFSNLPIIQQWDGYAYAFDYRCIEYKRGEKGLADLRSVKSKNDVVSLEYHFPGKTFFHKKAVTEVYIKKTNDSLFVRTVHTYPNDKLAVFTNSALRPIK